MINDKTGWQIIRQVDKWLDKKINRQANRMNQIYRYRVPSNVLTSKL